MIKKCEYCNNEFETKSNIRKYCKNKCFRLWRKNNYYVVNEEELKEYNLFLTKTGQIKGGKVFEKKHTVNNNRKPWNYQKKNCQKAWNKGLIMKNYYDEEQYKKFIDGCIKGGVSCRLKFSNNAKRTSIEIKVGEFLKTLNIKVLEEYPLLGITVTDFYLPDKHIVIYCDGDYWHNYPYGTKRDHEITKELNNANYKVIRFWENEINNNFELVKNKIIKEVQRL